MTAKKYIFLDFLSYGGYTYSIKNFKTKKEMIKCVELLGGDITVFVLNSDIPVFPKKKKS